MTFAQQFTDMSPTHDRYPTDILLILDRDASAQYRLIVGRYINQTPTDYRPAIDRVSTDYPPTIDRFSVDISVKCQPTINQYIDRHSGRHYLK